MPTRIQVRRDTAANWSSANPVLNAGEPAFVTDTGLFKVGDSATAFNSLVGINSFDSAAATTIANAAADSAVAAATTSDITEGTNLYFTDVRADTRINLQTGSNLDLSSKSTSDLSEGTNLYYTTARADSDADLRISLASINALADVNTTTITPSEGDALTWDASNSYWAPRNLGGYTDSDFDSDLASKTTDDLSEGSTNLYYTDARADTRAQLKIDALVGSAPDALNTLNELAAAINDDSDFSTTITNSIAAKLSSSDFNSTADTWIAARTTTYLSEGTNLYYTNTRADARIAAASIDALSDVDITSVAPTNGQALVWDSDNSRFEPGTVSGGGGGGVDSAGVSAILDTDIATKSIGVLSDVDITTAAPTNGQALIWNASNSEFEPGTVASSGVDSAGVSAIISATSIDALSDVDTTSVAPTNGQALVWNSTDSKFEPGTVSGGGGGSSVFREKYSYSGDLGLSTGTARNYIHVASTLTNVDLFVETAPTGAAVTIDVLKNGTTAATITLPAGQTSDTGNTVSVSFAVGDYITIDITQVGSTSAGVGLYANLLFTPT